jgi:hypothetical protein
MSTQKPKTTYGLKFVTHRLRSGKWGKKRADFSDGKWKRKRTPCYGAPTPCTDQGFHYYPSLGNAASGPYKPPKEAPTPQDRNPTSALLLVEVGVSSGEATVPRGDSKACTRSIRMVRVLGRGDQRLVEWYFMEDFVQMKRALRTPLDTPLEGSALQSFRDCPSRRRLALLESSKHPVDCAYREYKRRRGRVLTITAPRASLKPVPKAAQKAFSDPVPKR